MSEQIKKLQDQLEQKLKEVDNNLSQCVQLSDKELVEIIGGAYINAVVATPRKKKLTLTAECTGGECTGGNECGGSCEVCTP